MKKSEELFVLIKSLSQSEKRYFRIFCSQVGQESNYLRLFDAIDAQDEYDEKSIKKKFKGQLFVKQLHVTKNYLRALILKSLRNFHAKSSRDAEVKDLLRNVEILFEKELYTHCNVELKKAGRIAERFEQGTNLVEIHSWKRRLRQNTDTHDYQGFQAILQDQRKAIDMVINSNDYLQLIVGISGSITQNLKGRIKNEELLDNPNNALTMETKVMHYNAQYFRSIQEGKGSEAQKIFYELIDYLEQFPKRIKEEPSLYISSINNFVGYFVFNKKHDQALELIQRAKQVYGELKITSENRKLLKQILRTYNIELEIYRDTKEFEGKQGFIADVEGFVEKYRYKMSSEYLISFWFQLAYIFFLQKNFKKALKWVNNILSHNFKAVREDIQIQGRMLNLMIHLEQQNLFVLRYYVDNTRRYLRKKKLIEPFETALLRFFSAMGKAVPSEYKDKYQALYDELFLPNEAPLILQETLDYIDYKAWLEEKLN